MKKTFRTTAVLCALLGAGCGGEGASTTGAASAVNVGGTHAGGAAGDAGAGGAGATSAGAGQGGSAGDMGEAGNADLGECNGGPTPGWFLDATEQACTPGKCYQDLSLCTGGKVCCLTYCTRGCVGKGVSKEVPCPAKLFFNDFAGCTEPKDCAVNGTNFTEAVAKEACSWP